MYRNRVLVALLLLVVCFSAMAKDKVHKIVIQVSSNDPVTQKIVLNNAVNLQKHYGVDNVVIEIVGYGPGLGLLTAKNKQAKRVQSLATQDITFSACENTIKKITKKKGKAPKLTKGVGKTPSGAARIIELQEKGYSYLRP
jgi:intracellular sulfur oxidation DsrE/DsrF family protein